jgi:hypothetical protein
MAKSKSQKKQSKQQGGEGAADNAIKVFGNTNDQHAVSDSDNTIAMNSSASAQAQAPGMKGGKSVMTMLGLAPAEQAQPVSEPVVDEKKEGEVGASTEAIVGGKQSKKQLQKTIKKQLKQLKKGGASLNFSEYSSAPQPGASTQTATVNAMPQTDASHQINEGMRHHSSSRGGVASSRGGQGKQGVDAVLKGLDKAGDKMSKQQLQQLNQQLDKLQQQQQQGGVGLSEIVVPLVLLYASQKYAQGKTAKKNAKALSKSLRTSRKFSK